MRSAADTDPAGDRAVIGDRSGHWGTMVAALVESGNGPGDGQGTVDTGGNAMIPTRSIGKLLRGKATPMQLVLACLLGAMLGFVPGVRQAPGLLVALITALVVLNANLFVALSMAALTKLASLALMPVSFEVGRVLLDGPTQGLFKSMINAPVLALFGFEYYVTTGGLVLGAIVGSIAGFVLVALVGSFRKRMAKVEADSEKYKKLTALPGSRLLAWVLIGGGHGKKTYAQLASRRWGMPIRPAGVLLVAVLGVGVYFARGLLSDRFIRTSLQTVLEEANGATVDIASTRLDLSAGRLTISGLAMADAADLGRDLFRAAELTADVSGRDLLRGRIAIDQIVVRAASSGLARDAAGHLVGKKRPQPRPDQDKTIDDYLKDARMWRDRLEQIQRWLEQAGTGRPDDEDDDQETLRERLERQVRAMGYRRVRATHLIDGAPMLVIREIIIDDLVLASLPGDVVSVVLKNLSTQPWLLDAGATGILTTQSGRIAASLDLASISRAGGDSTMSYLHTGISGDWIATQLLDNPAGSPVQGGTVDLAINGQLSLAGGIPMIDLPLTVALHDTTLSVPGAGSVAVAELVLPIQLVGPVGSPGIRLDPDALSRALVDAGAAEAARLFQNEIDKQLGRLTDELTDQLGDQIGDQLKDAIGDGAGDAIRGLFGGGGDETKKKKD